MEFINLGAVFSEDRKHRIFLWRVWDESKPLVMFIGLNPSTADETQPDPTIKSVIRIAEYNGYGGIYMANCWTYIATNPKDLKFDIKNEQHNFVTLQNIASNCKDVVFAWGNFDIVKKKAMDGMMMAMFPNAKALHINKNGSPKHPLYCKKETKLIDFNPPQQMSKRIEDIKKPRKLFWKYGTFMMGVPARKHRIMGNVQFIMWKAGEQGHKKDLWTTSHKDHWETFTTKTA